MMTITRSSSAIAPPTAPTMMGINSRGRVVGGRGLDVVDGRGLNVVSWRGVNIVGEGGVDVVNGREVSGVG